LGFKGLIISKTTELTQKKCIRYRLWGSTVGIATVPWAGRPEVRDPAEIVSSPNRPDGLWGPPSLLFNGYRGYFPGVKRSGREIDHAPACSTQVKNVWSYTSSLAYAFTAWAENFTIYTSRCKPTPKKRFVPLYTTAVYV
jgi:hypothetical protein